MKVVGSTCALTSGGEEVIRCLADQSLSISRCSRQLDEQMMTVFLQDMNSCYSTLKELVPTLQPANRKASKMEILQGVIDYIWELQVELGADSSSPPSAAATHRTPLITPLTPLTALNAVELAGISVENGSSDDRILCR